MRRVVFDSNAVNIDELAEVPRSTGFARGLTSDLEAVIAD